MNPEQKRSEACRALQEEGLGLERRDEPHTAQGHTAMIRGLLVAAAIAAAAIGAASAIERTGSAMSPFMFTAGAGYVPLAVHCVPPTPQPGDTYQCRDGCYSDSKTPQGACSHHRGIDHPVQTDHA